MFKFRSFQTNMLLSVGGIFLLFALCFSIYQYRREKAYKIDIMHSRLQMYNYEMMQTLGKEHILQPARFHQYVSSHNVAGLRVTLISLDGRVLFDSHSRQATPLDNHLQRPEVQQALVRGNGYDAQRTSTTTHEKYFYSATRFDSLILRAAVPHSTTLTQSLRADNSYLYFAALLTVLLGIVLYYNTHRIARHIRTLREFATRAEEGLPLETDLDRRLPDDELGSISHTIITLYWKLRHSEEEQARIKRQLTQNAAHELKTPTASIHGYLESILEHPDMPADKRQHFLERCYAQSERMSKLLLDMATLTKLEDTRTLHPTQANKQLIDLVPILHNVLEDTALELQSKGIVPTLQVPARISLPGDATMLYSIFRNLIDNAIAYATGATQLTIQAIGQQQEGRHFWEIAVSDNGVGVEAEHLPRLFERFYRIDKGRSRKLGGTGLGLAIVKNATAAHGGTVAAETTPGGGLTVRLTLKRF